MLTATQITEILYSEGFQTTHTTSKKTELKLTGSDQFIYINKTAGDSPSSVIVNPIYSSMVNSLSLTPGVIHKDDWYHSSHLRSFPKRLNKGQNPIHYGIPFGFDSENGFRIFIKALKGTISNHDPFDDVRLADEDLNSVTSTEREALIKARVGQGPFREKLTNYWESCAVTGLSTNQLLIASHIKPWRVATNQERLCIFNGLLLSPNLDKAFDKGLVAFEADGKIVLSNKLDNAEANLIGINKNMQLKKIDKNHIPFLEWHRNNIFKR